MKTFFPFSLLALLAVSGASLAGYQQTFVLHVNTDGNEISSGQVTLTCFTITDFTHPTYCAGQVGNNGNITHVFSDGPKNWKITSKVSFPYSYTTDESCRTYMDNYSSTQTGDGQLDIYVYIAQLDNEKTQYQNCHTTWNPSP